MTTIIDTPQGISVYQAIAIKGGLKMWAQHKMQVNRMYTPKNMMAMATKITGKKFAARDYMGAYDALQAWIDAQRS